MKKNGEEQYRRASRKARDFIDFQLAPGVSVEQAHKDAGYKGSSRNAASAAAAWYRAAIDYRKGQISADTEWKRLASVARIENRARGSLRRVLGQRLTLSEEQWAELPDEDADLVTDLEIKESYDPRTGELTGRTYKFKIEDRARNEKMLADLHDWNEATDPGEELAEVGKIILASIAAVKAET